MSYKVCLTNLATSIYQNVSGSQNNLILEKYMATSWVLIFFFSQLFLLKMFKSIGKLPEKSSEYLFPWTELYPSKIYVLEPSLLVLQNVIIFEDRALS